ncbi:MAG TPA: ComEC/Rec2 family competence protein, partial [Candidatus Omnitrophota bacterium]|nr:ComEC/Rec2 family competence protein [Candidatus Omnitrophota bacterium]
AALVAERERWPLWLPVLLGAGVAAYFALPSEPPAWGGGIAFLLAAVAAWALRRTPPAMLALVAMATVALGFASAQGRAARVAAPALERPSGAVMVGGLAEEVEILAGGSQRVTLSESWIDGMAAPPRIRIRLKPDAPAVAVGNRITVRALLTPPPQPAMPGAFDFARHAWFQGLGAVGHAIGQPEIEPAEAGFGLGLNAFRQALTARIHEALPGPEGGVAAALITGEQSGIAQPVLDAYRDSGLAHLLSISGLHMTMVAGLVFFVVRGGLALVPSIALRHPIKKWAAVVALVATFLYMLMAGSPVPAQRSFLMTAIVLVAVLLDRQAMSMRLVAWAAVAVLALSPEAVVGPSFQMSFAAVVALIAAYEVVAPRLAAWKADRPGLVAGVALYLGGVVFSTLVAGTATAVYGIYHFNRFAVFSVVANMLAVPVTGFLVMPFALVAILLMPLGLEELALVPMGWGVEAVNLVAAEVASWPGAAITLPVLPPWGLAAFTVGGAWLCLW